MFEKNFAIFSPKHKPARKKIKPRRRMKKGGESGHTTVTKKAKAFSHN